MQALIFIEASGKAAAWSRITTAMHMKAKVIATGGHVCRFPDGLFPLGIDLQPGKPVDPGRMFLPEKIKHIMASVSETPENCPILIATDNDTEGDVIAYDLANVILKKFPERASRLARVRPGPITVDGIRTAIAQAERISRQTLIESAIQGRARAATDRWIGSTFSRVAKAPVGRVRTALLGATFILNKLPEKLESKPHTGEILFQSRSTSGGRPFIAMVSLTGYEDPGHVAKLVALARKFSGRIVPGGVRPLQSLSAAIAPRTGFVLPFNTADAIAHAGRHFGVSPKQAMRGLQDSYQAGLISYPRTESRNVSMETAGRISMLGAACGLQGLDGGFLAQKTEEGAHPAEIGHEGLHPVLSLSTRNAKYLSTLVKRPVRKPKDGWEPRSVRDLMTTLVSRRCFEAAREMVFEVGNWKPDNTGSLSAEESNLLRDLEWRREVGFNFPWSKDTLTGVRQWPTESVLLEVMAAEKLGKPSTFAGHLERAVASGDIEGQSFPAPPRPTPQGMAVLKRLPVPVWSPQVCRTIEQVLENKKNITREPEGAGIATRAQIRLMTWFNHVPKAMQTPLASALVSQGVSGGGRATRVAQAAGAKKPAQEQAAQELTSADVPMPS